MNSVIVLGMFRFQTLLQCKLNPTATAKSVKHGAKNMIKCIF